MHQKSTVELYGKAEDLFSNIPKEEVIAWCKHPITQSLQYSLYGDLAGYFESWSNGQLTGESADETIQKNSSALGSVAAIEAILTWIRDAEEGMLYD